MWSSLIEFKETEDDADAVANEAKPARERPRWLWPAVAAIVLVCGLIAAWAAGVFTVKTPSGWLVFEDLPEQADVLVDGENVTVQLKGAKSPFEFSVTAGKHKVLVKKDGIELAGEEVTVGTAERKPFRVRLDPLIASEPKHAFAGRRVRRWDWKDADPSAGRRAFCREGTHHASAGRRALRCD